MQFYKYIDPFNVKFPKEADTLDKAVEFIESTLGKIQQKTDIRYGHLNVAMDLLLQWSWIHDSRPFFRIWPGFLEAVRTLKIDDIKLSDIEIRFPNDIQSICLEMPVETVVIEDGFLTTIMIGKISHSRIRGTQDNPIYYILLNGVNKEKKLFMGRFYFSFKDANKTVGEYLNGLPCDRTVLSIAILVGLISNTESDTPLIEPVVIRALQEKWEKTQDTTLIEKSKRRGVFGWDIGKNLPDANQIEQMRKEALNSGLRCPHWRNAHFSRRVVGKREDGNKEWRFVAGSFINKDKMLDVPHGYYTRQE